VVIEGSKSGRWYDHEAGVGGDLINLIQRAHGTEKTRASESTTP
jgi:hypothetical protein